MRSVPTNDSFPQSESSLTRFVAVGGVSLVRSGLFSVLTLSALEIVVRRLGAPLLLIPLVASTAIPFWHAWRAARGTALRPALVWAALALAFLS